MLRLRPTSLLDTLIRPSLPATVTLFFVDIQQIATLCDFVTLMLLPTTGSNPQPRLPMITFVEWRPAPSGCGRTVVSRTFTVRGLRAMKLPVTVELISTHVSPGRTRTCLKVRLT